MRFITHSRREGYNVSSVGDKRFNAFHAKLSDGRSIEEHYQVDIKGYASIQEGKSKPAKEDIDLYPQYKALWARYLEENPKALKVLLFKASQEGYCLRDVFANTPVNQARALADLLNEHLLPYFLQEHSQLHYQYYAIGDSVGNRYFVFGSNLSGIHGLGAAKFAHEEFGAKIGFAEGFMDACYAIPTKGYYTQDKPLETLSLELIAESVERFKLEATAKNTKLGHYEFFVTAIGTGLAGYKDSEIAPLFIDSPTNCIFVDTWKTYLEKEFHYV